MDERIARFIERSENKYWGKYRALVEDRNDPEQIGRLKVRVPSLLGSAVTGWASPVVPYAGGDLGMFFIPQVGDLVWVEFAEGELEHPLWTGCGWTKPGGKTEVPAEAQQSYPDQQVIKTKSGNMIIFSDVSGSEQITIRAKSGCEIVIDSEIHIKADGKAIKVDCEKMTITGEMEVNGEVTMKSGGSSTKISGNTITGA